jgi:ADP-heptose:LPS heptosyltransferase
VIITLRALGLGDLLTATPALRGLARAFPRQRRVLYAPGSLGSLTTLIDPGLELREARRLGSVTNVPVGVRTAVDLHGRGPQSHRILLAAAPRAELVAFRHEGVRESDAGPSWFQAEHERTRWCRLLAAYGIAADPDDVDLPRPPWPAPAVARGATLLHPGAASQARRWPITRWAAVARSEQAQGRRVLITGSRGELGLAQTLAQAAGLTSDSVLAGRTSIAGLTAAVAAAGRVVCGDTGIAHLATGLRKPSVVLFGPVSPQRWGPPANRPWHVSLWAGREGDPHGGATDPGLLQIGAREVLDALAALPPETPDVSAQPSARR